MADHYTLVEKESYKDFEAEVNRLAADGYGMGEFQVVHDLDVEDMLKYVAVMVKYDYDDDDVERKDKRDKALTAETPYDEAIKAAEVDLEITVDPSQKVHKADILQELWKKRRSWRTKGAASVLDHL